MKISKTANSTARTASLELTHKDWFSMGKKANWLRRQAAQAEDILAAIKVYDDIFDAIGDAFEAISNMSDAVAGVLARHRNSPEFDGMLVQVKDELHRLGLGGDIFNQIMEKTVANNDDQLPDPADIGEVPNNRLKDFQEAVPAGHSEEAVMPTMDYQEPNDDKWVVNTPPELGTDKWKLPREDGDVPNEKVEVDFMSKGTQKNQIKSVRAEMDRALDDFTAGKITEEALQTIMKQKQVQLEELALIYARSKKQIVVTAMGTGNLRAVIHFAMWRAIGRKAGWIKKAK